LGIAAPAKAATYGGLKWLMGWRQRAIDEAMQGILTQSGPDAVEAFLKRIGKTPTKTKLPSTAGAGGLAGLLGSQGNQP
jgi:hypothetical protein